MIQLYHYLHCPYCIRVRMSLGYLQIPWESRVLPYSDESTPLTLTGKKMLPILKDDQIVMNESLEIIKYLDKKNKLKNETWGDLDQTLDSLSPAIYNVAMPFWVNTNEFDPESQRYFLKKKEAKRGPFSDLVKRRDEYESKIQDSLTDLERNLVPFWKSETMTIKDIGFSAQLWGLFSVPEFRFSEGIYKYLNKIKDLTHFNYTDFFWRNP